MLGLRCHAGDKHRRTRPRHRRRQRSYRPRSKVCSTYGVSLDSVCEATNAPPRRRESQAKSTHRSARDRFTLRVRREASDHDRDDIAGVDVDPDDVAGVDHDRGPVVDRCAAVEHGAQRGVTAPPSWIARPDIEGGTSGALSNHERRPSASSREAPPFDSKIHRSPAITATRR